MCGVGDLLHKGYCLLVVAVRLAAAFILLHIAAAAADLKPDPFLLR